MFPGRDEGAHMLQDNVDRLSALQCGSGVSTQMLTAEATCKRQSLFIFSLSLNCYISLSQSDPAADT